MISTINRKIRISAIYEAYEKRFTSKYKFTDFPNSFYRFVYVTEGAVRLTGKGEELNLKAGETVVFRAGEIEYTENTLGKNASILCMSFDMSGANPEKICNKVISLNARNISKLNGVIGVMKNEGGSPGNYLENEKSSYLHELANMLEIFLVSLLENEAELFTISNRTVNEFKEIVEIMHAHVTEPLTVKDIADKCGMSESNLKKIFARYSACSIHKYFLKMKIFRAIEMLDNNYNVAEISEMLSFNNQNYFGVVFKKETGYSPLNYRKKFLNSM